MRTYRSAVPIDQHDARFLGLTVLPVKITRIIASRSISRPRLKKHLDYLGFAAVGSRSQGGLAGLKAVTFQREWVSECVRERKRAREGRRGKERERGAGGGKRRFLRTSLSVAFTSLPAAMYISTVRQSPSG